MSEQKPAQKKKASSTGKKIKKTAKKEIKKVRKKHPVAFVLAVIAIIALGVAGYFARQYFFPPEPEMSFVLNGPSSYSVALESAYVEKGAKATYEGKDISNEIKTVYTCDGVTVPTVDTSKEATFKVTYSIEHEKLVKSLERSVVVTSITADSISIHFLELGNQYTGDSVYIKAGETDILIDAGSRQSSAGTIGKYLKQPGLVEDNKLEYVVATHAHQDHIAGFVGTNAAPGIFKQFDVGTIIDFPKTDATSSIYNRYVEERTAEVASGAKHFTALECWNESKEGAQKSYEIASGITMEILYHKYYVESAKGDENNYSVCLLFTQGENHYLFTGDLEAGGEASLVASNTLPQVTLFKGAHHGSYTANSDALLSVIRPEVICICCCAGTKEFRPTAGNEFPAQATVNVMGKYTEKIYVTSLWHEDRADSLNGNIVCTSLGMDLEVHGSNNDTILKETDWFKENRTWPSERR